MEGLLIVFLVLFLLIQIYFVIVAYRLFDMDARLHNMVLILTVIANKLGATENDVKDASAKSS